MGRKKVSEMTAEELAAYRAYMSQKKSESRVRNGPEKDNRTYKDRAEYQRNYQKEYRKKLKNKPK